MNSKPSSQKLKPRWKGSQRRIGITGGIASGKSSIGKFLQTIQKLPIIDADIYAREALAPSTASTKAVLERYGPTIRNNNDSHFLSIDRSALSKIIFDDSQERLWLEKLIHPIVKRKLEKELIKQASHPIVILIIPLLFEANLTSLCSEVWVVSCNSEQQIERLKSRDSLSSKEAMKRIQAQLPLEKKIKFADIVIDNSQGKEEWIAQVNNLLIKP